MNIYKKRLAWSAKRSLKGLYLKRNVEYLFKETDVKCKEEMRQRVREREMLKIYKERLASRAKKSIKGRQ